MSKEELFKDKYWDNEATRFKLPCSWSPLSDLDFYYKVNSLLNTDGVSILEIGCTPGRYLAFFGKKYKCQLFGLDKSLSGVKATVENLRMQGLAAKIVAADVFDENYDIKRGMFDVVMSHGFVEHFEDSMQVMKAIYSYARQGGLIISTIPNFNGLSGMLARLLAPEVYNSHKKIEPSYLSDIQNRLGGKVLFCGYTGHYHIRRPFRADTEFKRRHPLTAAIVNMPFAIINALSCATWFFLRWVLAPNKFLSKRITSIAKKR